MAKDRWGISTVEKGPRNILSEKRHGGRAYNFCIGKKRGLGKEVMFEVCKEERELIYGLTCEKGS